MSDTLENARKYLESLQRTDLSKLLAYSDVESGERGPKDWSSTYVIVRSPRPFAEAIAALSAQDRKRIAEAVVSNEVVAAAPQDIDCHTIVGQPIEGLDALLPELIIHQEMMIRVGTGGGAIQDVNDYYIARQARLVELCRAAGIKFENPHSDLWEWFRFYKEHFGTYAERRLYIRDMFRVAIKVASGRTFAFGVQREPTGWERVDRNLAKARTQLGTALVEEDFQGVGLLCREVIISLAQAVYDPAVHVPEDGVSPSATDANRMLEACIRHAFPGESYKEVRAHARAALALALNIQHRRTATRQLAALCLEAAASVAAVVAIISGRVG